MTIAPDVGFVVENGVRYAGKHLLIDVYETTKTPSQDMIAAEMVRAAEATGATVLFHHCHPFTGGGSSGVVILAESHLTWHEWPEEGFVAVDVFVCGSCDPSRAVQVIADLFGSCRVDVRLEKRGLST